MVTLKEVLESERHVGVVFLEMISEHRVIDESKRSERRIMFQQ